MCMKKYSFPSGNMEFEFFLPFIYTFNGFKDFEEKKKIHISGPNLIQRGFMVLIPAFSHVLCMGKSEGYVLSKLAGSRNSPSL